MSIGTGLAVLAVWLPVSASLLAHARSDTQLGAVMLASVASSFIGKV